MTAFAARTRPGPPENGRYQQGDTVPDSNGTIWTCAKGGWAGYRGSAVFVPATPGVSTSVSAVGAVESAFSATVSAAESVHGAVHVTVLTLTDVPQAVVNGTEYQSSKIYTLPEGRILVLGSQATLAQKTTSALASTLNASSTGAVSMGSAPASNVTLSSTMVDLGPSTAFTSSATINVAGTAVNVVLAASAQISGVSTPVSLYLNSAYATTADVDGDATQTWTGTIRLVWMQLGDY